MPIVVSSVRNDGRIAMCEWIIDRNPRQDELEVIFEREDFKIYGKKFLVWTGTDVDIDQFEMPPKGEEDGGGYYSGYWRIYELGVVAWMKIPEPPRGE